MLQGNWKMHRNLGESALYNLADNPEEDVDLTREHPEIARKLAYKLDAWANSFPNEAGSRAVVITPALLPAGL